MKSISFKNPNSESIFKWLFRTKDELEHVVFYFLSQLNATSPRYFPLFDATSKVRIVVLSGLRIPYSDRFFLKLYKLLLFIGKMRINRYKYVHVLSGYVILDSPYQIMHIDDPTYTSLEIASLQNWELILNRKNLKSVVVCTNDNIKKWLTQHLRYTDIYIIEQGCFIPDFTHEVSSISKIFSCAYSSPYIHTGSDLHANHGGWGANLLIDQIIPAINLADPEIEIHLIGELGEDAMKSVKNLSNVICHGRVDFELNQKILSKCSIGLYPRNVDFNRSMVKIFSYIGAGLPVVTFDLIDSEFIKVNSLGICVNTVEDFVNSVLTLKNNTDQFLETKNKVLGIRSKYSWVELANKMENLLDYN